MFEKEAEEWVVDNLHNTEEDYINAFKDGYNKANEYAKIIIQDLLNNSDEYARQRAMDFLKEE